MVLIATVIGPPMSAALGFALAAVAATSLLLARMSSRDAHVSVETRRLRVFKGEATATLVRLKWSGRRWVRAGTLSLEEVPGLESESRGLEPSLFELALRPVLAGRFEIRSVRLQVTDMAGLFVAQETLPVDLVVESLPLALLEPIRTAAPFPRAVGENPAGRGGLGQEFYAVGQYYPDLDTRDILWKRVARMEDESISVKVREANIRMSVRVGLAVGWTSPKQRAQRIDLVSEAVAQIGRLLLSLGTTLEVAYASSPEPQRARASNVAELVGVLMALSGTNSSVLQTAGLPECDLLLIDSDQLNGLAMRPSENPVPVVVVSENALPDAMPPSVSKFTGQEDLSALSMMVLCR